MTPSRVFQSRRKKVWWSTEVNRYIARYRGYMALEILWYDHDECHVFKKAT